MARKKKGGLLEQLPTEELAERKDELLELLPSVDLGKARDTVSDLLSNLDLGKRKDALVDLLSNTELNKRKDELIDLVSNLEIRDKRKRSGPPGLLIFLGGLVLGAAVGAIVALLLAPAPGEETREQLIQSGLKARGTGAGGTASAVTDRAKGIVANLQDRFRRAREVGQEEYARKEAELTDRFEQEKGTTSPDMFPGGAGTGGVPNL